MDRKKKNCIQTYLEKHLFEVFLSVAFIGLIAILTTVFFGYSYASNDDVMLRNIANGTYSGTSDAHMIYIMYPLGLVFSTLYRIIPGVEWYDVFSVGIHYLCWFLILLRVMYLGKQKSIRIACGLVTAAILIVFDWQYLIMGHYTVLAGVIASTAILYYVTMDMEHKSTFSRILVIALLLLCLLLRKQVFLLALPIGGIIFFVRLIQTQTKELRKQELRYTGIMIAVLFLISGIFFLTERIAYSSEEWKNFLNYNEARTDAYDYYFLGDYVNFPSEYEAMGLTEGDFRAVLDYNTEIVPGFSTEKMQEITRLGHIQRSNERSLKGQLLDAARFTFREALDFIVSPIGILLVSVFILQIVLSLCGKKKQIPLLPVLTVLYLFGIMYVFTFKKRFPEHVSFDLYIMCLSALAGFAASRLVNTRPKAVVIIACILFGGMMGLSVSQWIELQNNKTLNEERILAWTQINEYCSSHEENRYLMATKSFVFSTENLFAKALEAPNTLRLGTWVEMSPLQRQRKEQIGLTSVFEDYQERENCYLIQNSEIGPEWIEKLYGDRNIPVDVQICDEIICPGGRSFQVIYINLRENRKDDDSGK